MLKDIIEERQREANKKMGVRFFQDETVTPEEVMNEIVAETVQIVAREVLRNSVEKVMPWVEHDRRCILQQSERGEPTEDGGYRTMYAGVWYKSGEEPKCDCGLGEVLTHLQSLEEELSEVLSK